MKKPMGSSDRPQPAFIRRKLPSQHRSRATVDAIIEATLELSREEGFQSKGTHEIAERAGVSVGSLYQYFPNRESIFLSLYEKTVAALVQEIKSDMPVILDAPLPKAVRGTIEHLITIYVKHRHVLLDLKSQLPELRLEKSPMSFHAMIHGTLRVFLAQRATKASAVENETKAYFLEQIMLGTIQSYVLDSPAQLSRKAFVEHLTGIVLSYLSFAPRPGRATSRRS